MPNLLPALPEIFVLSMACIALLVDLFIPKSKRIITFLLVELALVGAFIINIYFYYMPTTYTFDHMYVHDQVATLLKLFIEATSFLAFIYARQYLKQQQMQEGEYYILGLFSVLGMLILVSGNSLLILFLGLEFLSLPLYAMVAMQRDSGIASEAAIKYYVMGAMASGILLYGLSMLYGTTGSLDVTAIANQISLLPLGDRLIATMGLVFIITGVAFKLGAAPFHMWAPDVYQGAPSPVTLFIGSAPKIAAFGLVIRLLVDAMPTLSLEWQQLFIVVAILSMAIGNIAAIIQTNIKRLLAYSSIAHMGYMSLGLLTATTAGYAASLFYMLIYALMATGAFAIITILSKAGHEIVAIKDLRGLNSRNPWLAFMMLLLMFSMAGIPPTAGFFAKLGVLQALVGANFVWLAAVALIFAVIGAYYYLAIVKVMYFEEPQEQVPFHTSMDMNIAISINSIAILVLGIFPTAMIDLCRAAFS